MEDHYEAVYLLSKLPENVSERGVRKLFEKKHNLHMSQYEHIPNHRAAIATFETTRGKPHFVCFSSTQYCLSYLNMNSFSIVSYLYCYGILFLSNRFQLFIERCSRILQICEELLQWLGPLLYHIEQQQLCMACGVRGWNVYCILYIVFVDTVCTYSLMSRKAYRYMI